jgi:hypothetical protein
MLIALSIAQGVGSFPGFRTELAQMRRLGAIRRSAATACDVVDDMRGALPL